MNQSTFRDQILGLADEPVYQSLVKESPKIAYPLERLREENLYVAMIGRQGAGKSSLVNALLFQTEVLPVGVAETTNVLCKVVHDRGRGQGIDVLFEDGTQTSGPFSVDFLRPYVDELLNEENQRKVKEVFIRTEHPSLKEGVAFVDTPGVDSLTSRNHQLTMEFLPKVSCAIFLFSTTPTLLQSEMNFLAATWEYSQNFFFVQNVWGEEGNEIASAQSDNLRKIRDLAKERGTDPDKLKVFTVDVHAALEAARNRDAERYQQSGAEHLLQQIQSFVNQGSGKIRAIDALNALDSTIGEYRAGLSLRLNVLKSEKGEHSQKIRAQIDKAKDELRDTRAAWREAKSDFDNAVRKSERDFDEVVDIEFSQSKRELFALVDNGALDSDRMEKAVTNTINVAAMRAGEVYQRGFTAAVAELDRTYRETTEQARKTMEDFEAEVALELGFESFASGMGDIMKWGGGIAVTWLTADAIAAGSAALGGGLAGITAAATTAAAALPIVGLAIAAAVILAGFGLKHYFSQKAKRKTKDALDDVIDESRRGFKENVYKQYADQAKEVKRMMDENMDHELKEKSGVLNQLDADLQLNVQEMARLTVDLTERQVAAALFHDKVMALHLEVSHEAVA